MFFRILQHGSHRARRVRTWLSRRLSFLKAVFWHAIPCSGWPQAQTNLRTNAHFSKFTEARTAVQTHADTLKLKIDFNGLGTIFSSPCSTLPLNLGFSSPQGEFIRIILKIDFCWSTILKKLAIELHFLTIFIVGWRWCWILNGSLLALRDSGHFLVSYFYSYTKIYMYVT